MDRASCTARAAPSAVVRRFRRSMAAPPGIAGRAGRPSQLFLQAGGLGDRRPTLHLAVEIAREILGGTADEIDALRGEDLGHLIGLQSLVGGAGELVDDLFR